MTATDYGFKEQLEMSNSEIVEEGINQILHRYIPGIDRVVKANEIDDRKGTDYWAVLSNEHKLSIDIKVRADDFLWKKGKKDDLALETWSVIGKKIGWTRDSDKHTDYIVWMWLDTNRFSIFNFRQLCYVYQQNWEAWAAKYGTKKQRTDGSYYGQCSFVPRRVVINEIDRVFHSDVVLQIESSDLQGYLC